MEVTVRGAGITASRDLLNTRTHDASARPGRHYRARASGSTRSTWAASASKWPSSDRIAAPLDVVDCNGDGLLGVKVPWSEEFARRV
jgi:hypothetical protein